jgi:D-alanyl-D-alanine carboxypeptidase (penicillin-binding protein 5/6)
MLLLVLCAMLIALAIGTLVNNCNGDDSTPEQTTPPTPTPNPDGEGDPPIDPSLLVPVFSGGMLPTVLPAANDETTMLDSELVSKYGVIIDVESNTILAGKNADTRMAPASMTKVMTLLVACERIDEKNLTDHVILAADVVEQMQREGASGVGFSAGDELTVKDLLYAVALESDGVASVMLARYVAGTEQAFVQVMNDKATEMGLISTSFRNPTGLHHDEHVTTCREMASIMIAAMDNEMVKTLLSTPSYKTTTKVYPRGLTFYSSYFVDVVEELRQIGYETSPSNGSVLAAKTGYTLEARYCLATLFVNKFEDKTYVAVTGHTVGMHLSCVRDYIRLYEDYTK